MLSDYWLRNPGLAPSAEIRPTIDATVGRIESFTVNTLLSYCI
jgi:hypothetical protein